MMNNFFQESTAFEQALDAEYKKQKGAFYTDTLLAGQILSFLQIPENAVILDPCCGAGSFLFAAGYFGSYRLYGADCNAKAAALCRKFVKECKVSVMDTLSSPGEHVLEALGLDKAADYVVGNPPYAPITEKNFPYCKDPSFLDKVNRSGGNLFVAALYRAFELACPEGIISYILPKNFLHVSAYRILRQVLLWEKQILSIIDLGACFKKVRGEQIVLTLKNQPAPENTIDLYGLQNGIFTLTAQVPQKTYANEIVLFSHPKDIAIYEKLNSPVYRKLGDVYGKKIHRGKESGPKAVTGKQIRKFGYKNSPAPQEGNRVFLQNIYSAESGIIAASGGMLAASQTITVVSANSLQECKGLIGFFHSRLCNYYLMKFCYNGSKLTMHTDASYLSQLPLPFGEAPFAPVIPLAEALEQAEYLSQQWFSFLEALDQMVYQIYHMTWEEIQHIDSEICKIQSPKWAFYERKTNIRSARNTAADAPKATVKSPFPRHAKNKAANKPIVADKGDAVEEKISGNVIAANTA